MTTNQIETIQDLFDDIRRDAGRASECETKERIEYFLQSIMALSGMIQEELES